VDDNQLLAAIEHDDSYRVIRVLAETGSRKTELVRGADAGLLVRKYVPRELANERAWEKLRAIEHPLLPQVKDLYWLPGFYVVVTTYVDGITLGELVDTTGPLGAQEAVRYLDDLCEAAGELHAHDIVHRDITPSNAVVAGGRAALIDLGNAHAHVEGAQRDTTTLGTYGFAAPEQFGFAQTDARSDVYALGGLLAFLLTGVNPGDEGFAAALENENLVPADLRLVVLKARAFEPSARYQTADELAAAAKGASISERAAEPLPMRIVRWFFPPLPESRRTWSDLRHLEKTFIVLLWGMSLLFLIPLSAGFFGASKGHSWEYAIAAYAVATIWTTTLVLLVREIHLLVTYLGPGRSTKEALKLLCVRVLVIVAFGLGLSVLVAALRSPLTRLL
jgi:serine/threonine protein kinase